MIEEPGNFRTRKIRIKQEPGALHDRRLAAGLSQRGAHIGCAAVLPDDRVVDRPPGRAVPHDRGLALVGDPDRGDIAGVGAGFRHRGVRRCDHARPDLLRIVLDQPRRRIDLAELLLRGRDRRERGIEQDGAGRGRALIDREEKIRHLLMLQFSGLPN